MLSVDTPDRLEVDINNEENLFKNYLDCLLYFSCTFILVKNSFRRKFNHLITFLNFKDIVVCCLTIIYLQTEKADCTLNSNLIFG